MPHTDFTGEEIRLPVVPLRGMVAFPTIPMSIEVSRERSIHAIESAEKINGNVLLIAQKDPAVDRPSANDLFTVGTVAKIKQTVKTADGGLRVILEGVCRASIVGFVQSDRYLSAVADCIKIEPMETGTYTEALTHEVRDAMSRVTALMPKISNELVLFAKSIKDPGMLADFIAANILLRYEDKQEILETYDLTERLTAVLTFLEGEEDILACEAEIHKRVREKLDQNQRDFYLREQMRTIQEELGDDGQSEVDDFFARIEDAHLPEDVEAKLVKEANRLSKTPYGSAESTVLTNYLDECLEIPFGKYNETVCDTAAAEKILARDHEGLDEVKTHILEFLDAAKFSGKKGGQILCLVGPPGVGKTSIAASIAEAMHRKYVRVSLGGIRDEADIRGHRKTYVGAMPGRIVDALQRAGCMNPLILLDEIDKLCSDAHGDPASAMLEVLDGEQNKCFRDHFVEMPIDLSECYFIATANTLDTVPRPLIDRMEIIELSAYTRTEKLKIAKTHLVPKQMEKFGIRANRLRITQSAIAEIIDYYTAEAGVRNLERQIAVLCRKSIRKFLTGTENLCIKASDIHEFLGARKYLPEKLASKNEVGVINGLAYTSFGGDLLKIEAAVLEGSGKIELTGSLGDVMKESAALAVSYVRSIASKYHLDTEFYKNRDIHLHFPEGAVPKDGPSAGVAITCALISALGNIPVRRDVAMTGELSLRGRTIAIGGLKEKTMAAYTHGIKTVLIPKDNVKDLEKIDEEAKKNLRFIPCETVQDAIEQALVFDKKERPIKAPRANRHATQKNIRNF